MKQCPKMYRIKVRTADHKVKTFWVQKLKETKEHLLYRRMTRNGELTDNLILGTPEDIIEELPAELDKYYGQMKLEGVRLGILNDEEKERTGNVEV